MKLDVLRNGKYIPDWVLSFMESSRTRQKTTCMFGTTYIDVFYQTDEDKSLAIRQVKKVFYFLRKEFEELRGRSIRIVLILSHKKKFVKKSSDHDRPIIGVNEINSAVCIKNTLGNEVDIIIYRIEDLPKVLIHESIHFLYRDLHGKEFGHATIMSIEADIKRQYPSVSHVNIMFNEAFTEAYAQYLYCKGAFTSIERQRDTSLHNVKKFLNLNNCETIEEFKLLKYYEEHSHPFAYILMSSALLHSDRFISWIEKKERASNLRMIVKESISSLKWKEAISKTTSKYTRKFPFKLSS